jgi:hypothetical protein
MQLHKIPLQLHCFCYLQTLNIWINTSINEEKKSLKNTKKRLNDPDISEDERIYYGNIVNAVETHSYDVPIPLPQMYEALERAEQQNKRVEIVPDDDFLEGGARYGQCDGWTYRIELK